MKFHVHRQMSTVKEIKVLLELDHASVIRGEMEAGNIYI